MQTFICLTILSVQSMQAWPRASSTSTFSLLATIHHISVFLTHIFAYKSCINKYLKNKIRILVTHQVHHLTNVSNIICLNEGRIQIRGSYDDLVNSGINMEIIESQNGQPAQIVPQPIVKEEEDEQVVDEKTNLVQMSEMTTSNFLLKSQGDLLTDASRDQDEKQRVGLLSSKTYFNYFRIGGGYFGACLCIALFIVSQLFVVLTDYWVSTW